MRRLETPGFFVPDPPTDFDRVGMPWLLAYRGGARRPLWWHAGPRKFGLILPRWVKIKYGLGGENAGSTTRPERAPGGPDA